MPSTQIRTARSQYKSVKRDSNTFKRWLEQAATSCGWSKIGNQDRTTADIATQIDLVANTQNQVCIIPDDVYAALCNAINGRKSCKQFFHTTNLSTNASTRSHEHFITILEWAATVLPRNQRELLQHGNSKPQRSEIQVSSSSPATPIGDSEPEWQVVKRGRRR
ncbi:uncharacterized protein F4807DRAFT_460779 [Annulohypoxylon truncatum]|uniref:uncharacterized protein n=1 Tax=Annulohypoxylon truncatum TaxID=327061 RepID=UPI0020086338|nr:uncharacterized protein F4807DRAFT_460779 [Annulohypoxylon truncatum]KAI1209562.1 hypothetical protein F4807DRAFT_460779 [Annulohypoxylon truncatum]